MFESFHIQIYNSQITLSAYRSSCPHIRRAGKIDGAYWAATISPDNLIMYLT